MDDVLVAQQCDCRRRMRLDPMARDLAAARTARADRCGLNGQWRDAETGIVERELKMRTAHGALSHAARPLPTKEHIGIE